MLSVVLENEYGKRLELSHNESRYQISSISGLNPPKSNIISSKISDFDGERFSNSSLEKRNIVINFFINGDVETNRNILNSTIFCKQYIKIYINTSSKNVYIEGYVDGFEYDIFSEKCNAQISILCFNPFFVSVNSSTDKISSTIDLFEFPFSIGFEGIPISENTFIDDVSIENTGNAESGIYIELVAKGIVVNPTVYNITTSQHITLNVEMQLDDLIQISTFRGNKYIKKIDGSGESNIINSISNNSKWIQLISGENIFRVSAGSGIDNLTTNIVHSDLFGGI